MVEPAEEVKVGDAMEEPASEPRRPRARRPRASKPATLTSFDPATGTVRGEVEATRVQDVAPAVRAAREAQPAWAALGPRGRARALADVREAIADRLDDLVDVVSSETG
jgi:acyl-CoA reductase-like NAD-dependent aldehyde dehydrogenase